MILFTHCIKFLYKELSSYLVVAPPKGKWGFFHKNFPRFRKFDEKRRQNFLTRTGCVERFVANGEKIRNLRNFQGNVTILDGGACDGRAAPRGLGLFDFRAFSGAAWRPLHAILLPQHKGRFKISTAAFATLHSFGGSWLRHATASVSFMPLKTGGHDALFHVLP